MVVSDMLQLTDSASLVNKANLVHNFLSIFISFLYMFRATVCPSSGEITYLCDTWYLSLCVDDCLVCMVECIPPCIPLSHRYSYFSWWWAYSRPKHIEERNKRTKKLCTTLALCTILYKDARLTKHKIRTMPVSEFVLYISFVLYTSIVIFINRDNCYCMWGCY